MRCVHLSMTLLFCTKYFQWDIWNGLGHNWSRLLIATIQFTILKNSKKNIVNSIEVVLNIFLGCPL